MGATFVDHDSADAAVEQLRRDGISDKHLGILVRGAQEPDRIGKQVDSQAMLATARGIAIGIPVGMLASAAIVAVSMPATGLDLGPSLVGGGMAGISLGAFFGGVFGLALDRSLAEEEAWEDVEVEPGHVLVAARAKAGYERITSIFQQHGGRLVQPA
ncbi:hypothetical protein B7486_55875 [cyanobacterium TDX16]|nr:hypothetical protein B7486_55875 [cyanobacterium TDX16]